MFSIVQHLFSFYAFYRAAISSWCMPYIKDLLSLRHILLSAEPWFLRNVCLTLRICFPWGIFFFLQSSDFIMMYASQQGFSFHKAYFSHLSELSSTWFLASSFFLEFECITESTHDPSGQKAEKGSWELWEFECITESTHDPFGQKVEKRSCEL